MKLAGHIIDSGLDDWTPPPPPSLDMRPTIRPPPNIDDGPDDWIEIDKSHSGERTPSTLKPLVPSPMRYQAAASEKPPTLPPPDSGLNDWIEPPGGTRPSALSRGFVSGLLQQNPAVLGEFFEATSHLAPEAMRPSFGEAAALLRDVAAASPKEYEPSGRRMWDIKGIDDALTWAGEGIGQVVASSAVPLGLGATGAVMGGRAGGRIGALGGVAAGAFMGSFALNAGEVYSALKKEGVDAPRAAQLSYYAGGPMAALDAINPAMIIARFGGIDGARRKVAQFIARRVIDEARRGATREGLTEAVQEAIKEATIAIETGKPLTTESLKEITEAGALGALGGGILAAPAGIRRDQVASAPGQKNQRTQPPAVPPGAAPPAVPPGAVPPAVPPGAVPAAVPPGAVPAGILIENPTESIDDKQGEQPIRGEIGGRAEDIRIVSDAQRGGETPAADRVLETPPPAETTDAARQGIESIADRIIGIESAWNPEATNPASSAAGLGQFIRGTWLRVIREARPDLSEGRNEDELLALRRDPHLAREMVAYHAAQNARALASSGLNPTPGAVYLAHFLGIPTAISVLGADPATPLTNLVGDAQIRANPSILGGLRSAGDLIAWAEAKMTRASPMPVTVRRAAPPSLDDIIRDTRSPDEIRASIEAAATWQPTHEWQDIPIGIEIEGGERRINPETGREQVRLPPDLGSRQAPVKIETPADILIASSRTTEPSPAQAEAGNYREQHIDWRGLSISIKTEAGQTRSGIDRDGNPRSVEMPVSHGYIRRSKGSDGDQIGVYVGPAPQATRVFVIDQIDPQTRRFDEHKALIAFPDLAQAREAYAASFSDGLGNERIGAITPMSVAQFRQWLRHGNTTKPVAYAEGEAAAEYPLVADIRGTRVHLPDAPHAALFDVGRRLRQGDRPAPAEMRRIINHFRGRMLSDRQRGLSELNWHNVDKIALRYYDDLSVQASRGMPVRARSLINSDLATEWARRHDRAASHIPAAAGPVAPIVYLSPEQIIVDPARFQYKSDADAAGVTGALRGAQWDERLANPVTAWQDGGGSIFVVNGHQRVDLAKKSQADGQADVRVPARVYREADGYSAEYMRALGAFQNIAEGSGTEIDAARILRTNLAGYALPSLPPQSRLVRDARALASLSDDAFGMVINGVVPASHAAHVGRLISDPSEQLTAIAILARAGPENAEQAGIIVEDVRAAGFLRGSQPGLFGDEEFSRSLITERYRILDRTLKMLRRTRAAFRAAIEQEGDLAQAGNVLSREANIRARSENERLAEIIRLNATRQGPISSALSKFAGELAAGKPVGPIVQRFITEVRSIVGRDEEGLRSLSVVDRGKPEMESKKQAAGESAPAVGESAGPALPALRHHATEDAAPLRVSLAAPLTERFAAEAEKFYSLLRGELDRIGLSDVGLKFADSIQMWIDGKIGTADGVFFKSVITIALDARNKHAILHHEVLHAMRRIGLFTQGEWSILARASNARWRRQFDIDRLYGEWPQWVQTEEGVAAAYTAWTKGSLEPPGHIARLFKRMRDFIEALGNALRGAGFVTAEDIFERIYSGEIGRRAADNGRGTIPYAVHSGDGDIFQAEIISTADGPLIEGYPLSGDPDNNAALFALRSQPMTASARQRVMQGFIARGQFIDRAARIPFHFFGGIDNTGQWKPGKYLWSKDPAAVTGALIGARVGAAVVNPVGAAVSHGVGRLIGGRAGAYFGEGAAAIAGGLPGVIVGAAIGGAAGKILMAEFSPQGRFAFLNPILEAARFGLINRYGLDPEYVRRERIMKLEQVSGENQALDILKTLKKHAVGPEEARVLQAVLTLDNSDIDRLGPQVRADMEKLAAPIRQAIDRFGQELVAVGWVSRESFDRLRGRYLHILYREREAQKNRLARFADRIMAAHRKRVIAGQLKDRGIFEDRFSLDKLMEAVPGWKEGARGKPHIGDKFVRLDEVSAQAALPLPNQSSREKVLRTVWWPADQPIPQIYSGFRNMGIWELREWRGEKPVLWRDFTKAERERMGEILDARYTIAKTIMMSSHNVAVGRFYQDIAVNQNWASSSRPAGNVVDADTWVRQAQRYWRGNNIDWVRVPDTEIEGTGGKKKWGALAGKYVREEIWRDLHELDIVSNPNSWRAILTQWKLNKTALSPVVHMNNVVSNFHLMYLADIRFQDIVRGLRSFVTRDKHFQEALHNGAFGADMMTQEIRDKVFKPLLDEIMRSNTYQSGGRLGLLGLVSKFTSSLWAKYKQFKQWQINAYRLEDEIFRMATYIRRRDLGDSEKEAADLTRAQFVDYDIRAPWVNVARNTVLPFISYTYGATPMIARAIAHYPWKLAVLIAVYSGANLIAYMMTGPDGEDEKKRKERERRERRSLPEREQGATWMGTQQMMRWFWNDAYGNPIFYDMRRHVPVGDLFDMRDGVSTIDLPAFMQMGGPLIMAAELFLNRQAFMGREIVNTKTDDWWDRTGSVVDYVYKAWMPSAAWIPGSWYWDKIDPLGPLAAAMRGEEYKMPTDRQGRPYSKTLAVLSSVGIKLKPQDVEDGFALKAMEYNRVEHELRAQATRIVRQKERNIISTSEFDRRMSDLIRKLERLGEKRAETFAD